MYNATPARVTGITAFFSRGPTYKNMQKKPCNGHLWATRRVEAGSELAQSLVWAHQTYPYHSSLRCLR